MTTENWRKLVVALVGASLAIATRHGVDTTDAVIVLGALGVGYIPNGKVKA